MITGPVAVTGATGWIGSRVVEAVAASGVRVVALARDPARVTADVESRRCDYDDPASLRAALSGVGTLVFVSSDGEADVVLRQHLAVVAAAAAAGVRRVTYLSSIDADPASPFCFGRTNGATEAALLAACEDVRVVRAGLFVEFLHALVGEGDVRVPDTRRFATVTRAEVADTLVESALDGDPEPVRVAASGESSFADLAAELGRRFVPVTLDDYRTNLVSAGETPWWSYAYASLMQSIAEGRWAMPGG